MLLVHARFPSLSSNLIKRMLFGVLLEYTWFIRAKSIEFLPMNHFTYRLLFNSHKLCSSEYGTISRRLTSKNCMTVVSTIISGRVIRWTTPFLTGILARRISARTTPVEWVESPITVFDLT